MASGREMFLGDETDLRRVPVTQAGGSLSDMMRLNMMHQHYRNQDAHNQQQLALHEQQLVLDEHKQQQQLFRDTYTLWQDPRLAGNLDAQDAIAGQLGAMAGIPQLNPESMRLGRESLKKLYKAAFDGDPNQTSDAYAELAVRVSNPQDLEKLSKAFEQFDFVREKTDAVRVHRQFEQARYDQLQDATVQVDVGRTLLTPHAMHFRDALRGTNDKSFTQLIGKVDAIVSKTGDNREAIEQLLVGQRYPQYTTQNRQALVSGIAAKRQELRDLATQSTKLLEDVHGGVSGLSFAGQSELKHRNAMALELDDAYGTLEDWAKNPFDKDKLRAAQRAGQMIEDKRLSMEKLNETNNTTALRLKQDAFGFRQTVEGRKQAYEEAVQQGQLQFASLPSGQQTTQAAAKIAQAIFNAGGVLPKTQDILLGKKDPNAPSSVNTINMSQEKAEAKKVGEEFGDQYSSLQKADLDSRAKIAKYDRMGQLLATIETGKLEPAKTAVQAIAESLGVSVDKSLATKQAFQALSGEIALSLRNPSGGAGMPGALSDRDLQFLQSMTPDLAKTTEGNKLIVETARKLAKRDQAVAKMAREYRKQHGQFDEGFFDELAAYSEKNQMFSTNAQPTARDGGAVLNALPQGSKQIGTSGGKPVYQTPDGKRFIGE